VDRAETERFLKTFDPAATEHTFQTFDDNKDRLAAAKAAGRGDRFAKILHGTLDQHFPELRRRNDQGAGVFITVNRTDLKGRRRSNIKGPQGLLDMFAAAEGHGVAEEEPSPCKALNALALANPDKWVPELFGGIAIFQKGTGGYRVSGVHMGKDLRIALGRDPEATYEEDLSIHPVKGIKDFGVATDANKKPTGRGKYSALDLVMAVRDVDLSGAFAWLDERLRGPEEQPGGADGGSNGGGGNCAGSPESAPGAAPEPKPAPKADDWPVLDPAALHGLAGDVVRAIAPHTESDPVALLVQTIVYFGNAIGRGPYYLIEDDKHFTNLFDSLVGETSQARKGTSAGRIRGLFMRADPQWSINCTDGGMASGEGIITRIRDRHETRDKRGKPVIDEGVPDKRLLIDQGEFYGALAVMKREGNTLSPVIRDMWDGRPLRNLTKNSPQRCLEPHGSIIAHITEDELRQSLDHTSLVNGFANRFLFTLVKRSKFLPDGGATLDEETKSTLGNALRTALATARKIGRVIMAAATSEMWAPVYIRMASRQPGLYADACKRGDAQTIRLSMLLCAARRQRGYRARAPASRARDVGLLRAERQAHLRRSARGASGRQRRAGAAGLSRSDISALLRHHKSSFAIAQALQRLLAVGKARFVPKQGTHGIEMWFAV
jgi:hypothetical protein